MKNQTKLIAIAGGSGAGKTWLADRLQHAFGPRAARLSLDDFYRNRSHLPSEARAEINFDHPDAIDWPLFEQVVGNCRQGRPTPAPRYDFATHARLPGRENFVPAPLVLVDGLWLLWRPHLLQWFDLKIYLDCPAQLRLERRLGRDVAERGRSPEAVRGQFWKTVAPMHDQFVAPQAKWADLTLKTPVNRGELRELVEILELELRPAMAPATHGASRDALQAA